MWHKQLRKFFFYRIWSHIIVVKDYLSYRRESYPSHVKLSNHNEQDDNSLIIFTYPPA